MIYAKPHSALTLFSCVIMYSSFLFASELHIQRSDLGQDVSLCKQREYDYLLIMGCHALTMSKRIKYAMDLTNDGLAFKQLVFLTKQQKLTDEETPAMIQEVFTTILPHNGVSLNECFPDHEASMLKFLLNHTSLPKKWHQTKKIIIESPKWHVVDDKWVEPPPSRPIEEWLKWEPKPGSILAISDRNNMLYDNLPSSFSIKMASMEDIEIISSDLPIQYAAKL